MIISCHKCNKKFEIADKLISNTGRLLQCGSCSHQWYYVPEKKIILTDQVKESQDVNQQSNEIIKSPTKKKVKKNKKIINTDIVKSKKQPTKVKKDKKVDKATVLAMLSDIFLGE